MKCWMCRGRMRQIVQSYISGTGYWVCDLCDVESCLPGQERKPFKSGVDYFAKLRIVEYWDGLSPVHEHMLHIETIDHGKRLRKYSAARISCP